MAQHVILSEAKDPGGKFMKNYFVYIITNKENRVLYTGVTNDLQRRIYEHKRKLIEGFSKKYNLNKLVHHEMTGNIEAAILREKQLKDWLRKRKIELITAGNRSWDDLSECA